MIMSRKILLMLLVSIICSIHTIAQTDYYYYKGKKIPLTLNENRVIVSISKDCDETIKRIHTNVHILSTIKDETLDIIIISRSDYEKLTSQNFWEEDEKSVIKTSSYFTEDNKEVFETPYLNVELMKKEDEDLLTSYVEKYKLRIAGKSIFMPWYILAITPESEKSSLKCANELYESGDFAGSVADFAEGVSLEETTVQSITTATTEKSSEIYDLQGHKLSSKPARGIYIHRGQKKLAESR